MDELKSALGDVNLKSSPGADDINYHMIKHLSRDTMTHLLQFYNNLFTTGFFPRDWQNAIVVPVLKPGKDRGNIASYRPISKTSCLSKLLEKMVKSRLFWYLDQNDLLAKEQCGFRPGHSTMDPVVRLTDNIHEAFYKKQHVVAVFLDIDKAFDTVWRPHIISTLAYWGVHGHMLTYISNYLSNRTLQVQIAGTLSRSFPVPNGVPQGGVLSPLLFLVAINSLRSSIPSSVQVSLYADDVAIFCRAKFLRNAERLLQGALNSIVNWAKKTGLNFSANKTKCVNFHRLRRNWGVPNLTLNKHNIPVVDSVKFLGVTLDSRLYWTNHVKDLRAKCYSGINILKVLSRKDWGADRISLLRIYRATVRAKIDYGSFVYSSAPQRILALVNSIHHQGLRLAVGAFRSSPVLSICAEAGDPPLDYRRVYLGASYLISRMSFQDHYISDHLTAGFLDSPFCLLARLGVHLSDVTGYLYQLSLKERDHVPPWAVLNLNINTSLAQHKKDSIPDRAYQQLFHATLNNLDTDHVIFTDGSKCPTGTGCALVGGNLHQGFQLPAMASVQSAELFAIYKAVALTLNCNTVHTIICSDSLSSLDLIRRNPRNHSIVNDIRSVLYDISQRQRRITLLWVPGHAGISGNESADLLAKEACANGTKVDMVIADDIKNYIKSVVENSWSTSWENVTNNKLRRIKSDVKAWLSSSRRSRREEVLISRLRIGHSRLTHGYLMEKGDRPWCTACDCPLTIDHILVDCSNYRDARNRFKIGGSLAEILKDDKDSVDAVISFTNAVNLSAAI